MPEPRVPGVRYLGYLSRGREARGHGRSPAVVCPSPYESLSIVLLEGLALGTPALVNARSAVLEDHCRRSNAGLCYADADEFGEALDLLAAEARSRRASARRARYVRGELPLGRGSRPLSRPDRRRCPGPVDRA